MKSHNFLKIFPIPDDFGWGQRTRHTCAKRIWQTRLPFLASDQSVRQNEMGSLRFELQPGEISLDLLSKQKTFVLRGHIGKLR